MTPFGDLLTQLEINPKSPVGDFLWRFASREFAAGAEGRVLAVQSNIVFPTSFWATAEYQVLALKNEIQFLSSRGSW